MKRRSQRIANGQDMTSSNEPPGDPAGAGQRGRRPQTIDLTATEVANDPAKGSAQASGAEQAASGPGAESRRGPAWLPASIPWPLAAAAGGGAAVTLAVLALAGV